MVAFQNWINDFLNQTPFTDIVLNGSKQVLADTGFGLKPTQNPTNFHEDEIKTWILQELALVGKTWDARFPFVDATIRGNLRIHVAFPPVSPKGLLISLRQIQERSASSQTGFSRWNQSKAFEILASAVQTKQTVIIGGATGSGKTTLAADLMEVIPEHERIIALEDTPELNPRHPHFIKVLSRPHNADGCGEITLRDLIRQTLRMRPDRVLLGECRGAEVLDLLQALNTGHTGSIATIHANSARDILKRLELLVLLYGSNQMNTSAIRELICNGVQYVAHVHREQNHNQDRGKTLRVISEILKLEGREGDTILIRKVF